MAMVRWWRSWVPVAGDEGSEYTPPRHLLEKMLAKGLVEEVPRGVEDVGPVRYRLTERGWTKASAPTG